MHKNTWKYILLLNGKEVKRIPYFRIKQEKSKHSCDLFDKWEILNTETGEIIAVKPRP